MLRAAVTGSLMVCFALLLGCPPAQDPYGAKALEAGGEQAGTISLTIVNKTQATINHFNLMTDPGGDSRTTEFATMIFSNPNSPDIKPGESREFHVKAGAKKVELSDYPSNMSHAKTRILYDYKIDIQGPTQIVVYDTDPPPEVTAPAGAKQVVLMGIDAQKAKDDAAREAKYQQTEQKLQKHADAEFAKCQQLVPPKGERAAPSRAKADGKWTCVLSGGASGTDYVNVVQLASGSITATVTGFDRNATWEGAIVGDELHFRYPQLDSGGGKLKIDPGGHALIGPMWIYSAQGQCVQIQATCTR